MSDLNQISMYQPEENSDDIKPPREFFNDHTDTSRVTIKDGTITASSESSRSSHEFYKQAQEYNRNSWKETARDKFDLPTANITSDTMVTIGGIRSSVKAHLLGGVLKPDGQGGYETTESYSSDSSITNQSEHEFDSDEIHQPDDVAESINKTLEPFSDTVVNTMVPLVIDSISKGKSIDNIASQLSQMANMNQSEALERINHIASTYEAEAQYKLGKSLGLSKEAQQEIFAFAKGDAKGQQLLNEAIQKQVSGKTMTGWKALVDHYYNTVPPSAEALKKAGIETKLDNNKQTLVKFDGNWVNLKTAMSLGWL